MFNGLISHKNHIKMASVLVLMTPIQKNRKALTSALLLNSNRVIDFRAATNYTTTRTLMYYEGPGDTWELTLNHSINTVSTRLAEDVTNQTVYLNVVGYKVGFMGEKSTTIGTKWKVSTDRIIYGIDISTTQSHLYVDRGNGVVMRLTTSHLVSDISRAYSTSASLSAS